MAAAVASFSAMDATMKHLVASYPAMQVTFLRGLASLPLLLAANVLFAGWRQLVPVNWPLHLLRGVLSVATLCVFIYAVGQLSLADAYAIFMCAPLLITALSVFVLHDKVEKGCWVAIVVGMMGMAIVLKPSGAGVVTLGGLAAFVATCGYALSVITIRIISRTDSRAATLLWPLILLTLISGVLSLRGWTALRLEHWPWIVAMGVSGALGQHFITEAFRSTRLAVIAPLEYTALVWGLLFDWLLWSTVPGLRMLTGSAIVVMSGLYVIRRQREPPVANIDTVQPNDT
jgi:drug/metabolite transporter (DMT)-like permease